MNTCLDSISIQRWLTTSAVRQLHLSLARWKGCSLPEVMIALLLVSLSAGALISTTVATRMQAESQVRFSAALRLAVELSDWVRQGGMRVLDSALVNPMDLIEGVSSVTACFSEPCQAETAAIFYLHHWRSRLFLKVPNARILVCQDNTSISAAPYDWSCDSDGSDHKARVIKIGWPQRGDASDFPPQLVIGLS